MPLDLTFWGVRGSIPTPVAENLGHGGNTACLTIRHANDLLIFDGGSGIRALGNTISTEHAHLFLTHFHWDHIQGIPYFAPIYDPDFHLAIHSSVDPATVEQMLTAQMRPPYYPVLASAKLSHHKIQNDGTKLGEFIVRPFPLHHPNGATGYRIESPEATIVYASDHEHGHAPTDAIVRNYAQDADILIYDAQYTPDEYEHRRGWGHSTWREATKLAHAANVKQLLLFHHDPNRTDRQLEAIISEAQSQFANTIAAKEGWSTKF